MILTLQTEQMNAHEMVVPINYINEWKHLFTVKCTCTWESNLLGDSSRKVKYRDPYTVATQVWSQHYRAASIYDYLLNYFVDKPLMVGHKLVSVNFDNSRENFYELTCLCSYQLFTKVRWRQKARELVRIRKLIRAHQYTLVNPNDERLMT